MGLLKRERFIGARDDVYQVLIPMEKKEFSYVRLNQQPRRERVSAVLSQVAGRPLRFEAVLDQAQGDKRMDDLRQQNQASLVEAFGRDNVQIDEGTKA